MHRIHSITKQPLLSLCRPCLEKSIVARNITMQTSGTATAPHVPRQTKFSAFGRYRTPPKHTAAQFSTGTIQQSVRIMNHDALDEVVSSRPVISPALEDLQNNADSKSPSKEASEFFDPSIVAPKAIEDFRKQYEICREENHPDDFERLLSTYRSIADDPELLSQLQPIDFMYALNCCRGLLNVIPKMRRILQDVEKTAYKHITEIYDILLRTHVHMSDFRGCANMLDGMERKGIQFGTFTYHIMLDICKNERDMKKAKMIVKQMTRRNVEVTATTYLMLLSVCARCKDWRFAQELFDEMPELRMVAERAHYNALLNTYVHAKHLSGARAVFQQMEEDGIARDTYTYSAMLKLYRSLNYTQSVQETYQQMLDEGLKPNVQVLTATGREPQEILEECQKSDIEIGRSDFSILIIQSLRKNQFAHIPTILEAMHQHGHHPDIYTFTALIDANIKMNQFPEAKDVFMAMKQANIQPDVIAYSAIIAAAITNSAIQESLDYLRSMVSEGLLPNLLTFNSLLSASVGEIGIDTLKIIRETMVALQIQPDQRSFNTMLSAYALQGDIKDMMNTLNDMKRSRVVPDALTYQILISGFLQNGDLRYAMEWYFKMVEGNFTPAPFVVNNLMAALHGSGQGQQVMMLWSEMGRLGIRKNQQSFEIALDACQRYNVDSVTCELIEKEFKEYLVYHELK